MMGFHSSARGFPPLCHHWLPSVLSSLSTAYLRVAVLVFGPLFICLGVWITFGLIVSTNLGLVSSLLQSLLERFYIL